MRLLLAVLAVSALYAGCNGTEEGVRLVICGNGRLDPGEQCDDGNRLDNDACLSTCVYAKCGDGFIDLAHEACDGFNLNSCGSTQTSACTCADFGLSGGQSLSCTSQCQIDTSNCGAVLPPTPTPPPTATATITATPVPCGNGVIEPGETCATCPQDCMVLACTATSGGPTVSVTVALPTGQSVTGLTLLVGYQSSVVNIPGSGAAASVAGRVKNKPSNAIVAVNDLDYALRAVLSRSNPIPAGQVFTIEFDGCTAAPAPTATDFGCTVEGCANTFGTVNGCTCSVSILQ